MQKFQVEIDIELARDEVVNYYRNTDNLKYWISGFKSYRHLLGSACALGSKFEVVFQVGNMNITVIETITRNDLPEEIWFEEVSDGISNLQKNLFIDIEEHKTKWVIICNYNSADMKHIGLSAFKKKTTKFMESFKGFVEAQSVRQ